MIVTLWLLVWALGMGGVGAAAQAAGESIPRPLGRIVIDAQADCGEQKCYEFSVTCPEIRAPEQGVLTVGEPALQPARGTILLMTGGPGTQLFQEAPHSRRLVDELRSSGFRTVQLQWRNGWLWGSPGEKEGHARLACRPATVARWIYDQLTPAGETPVLCATGNSGGASQASYMLTHYGLENILSAVVPTGGPPMGRMDLSCLRDEGATRELWFPNWATRIIDGGFGFERDGSGPCALGDDSQRDMLRLASVASGTGDYHYPKTMVWFLFGGADASGATAQGLEYHDLLEKNGSPLLRKETLPGVPHGIHRTPDGTGRIRAILLAECRAR